MKYKREIKIHATKGGDIPALVLYERRVFAENESGILTMLFSNSNVVQLTIQPPWSSLSS